mmetsp:Transcript_14242/g.30506  ORF Transcript_14242/g.30506 Transcript_14242/m.30506 type:complete len:276 (+) Transcript_14242:469-1296(+)
MLLHIRVLLSERRVSPQRALHQPVRSVSAGGGQKGVLPVLPPGQHQDRVSARPVVPSDRRSVLLVSCGGGAQASEGRHRLHRDDVSVLRQAPPEVPDGALHHHCAGLHGVADGVEQRGGLHVPVGRAALPGRPHLPLRHLHGRHDVHHRGHPGADAGVRVPVRGDAQRQQLRARRAQAQHRLGRPHRAQAARIRDGQAGAGGGAAEGERQAGEDPRAGQRPHHAGGGAAAPQRVHQVQRRRAGHRPRRRVCAAGRGRALGGDPALHDRRAQGGVL